MKRTSTFCRSFIMRVALLIFFSAPPLLSSAQWAARAPEGNTVNMNGVKVPSDPYSFAFVENIGQITDLDGVPLPDVKYLLNHSGMKIQLRSNGFSYDTWMEVYGDAKPAAQHQHRPATRKQAQAQKELQEVKYHRIDVAFKGGNPAPVIEALEQSDDNINIINQAGEISIRQFRKIVYREVYPGIDLEFVVTGDQCPWRAPRPGRQRRQPRP